MRRSQQGITMKMRSSSDIALDRALAANGQDKPVAEPIMSDIKSAADTLARCLDAIGPHVARSIDGSPASLAGKLYKVRRKRDALFPALSIDPSWDMLLYLYDSDRLGREVTISSACHAAAAPLTTGLRHVEALVNKGLVARRDCDIDRRRTFLDLTEVGRTAMDAWVLASADIIRRWAFIPA